MHHVVRLMRATGPRTFTAAEELPLPFPPYSIALADLDGDKAIDVLVGDYFGTKLPMAVLWNDGKGKFPRLTQHPGGAWIGVLQVADFDGDGDPDVLAGGQNSGDITVLLNDGRGGLTLGGRLFTEEADGIAVADLDGRCGPDVVANSLTDFSLWVYFAGGPP
jgi:hypothetical protein